ncbi:hypothetical protein B7494_g1784 [Chlorociboria aeruginascens]|nr:hypothetical protein B7494_g1784 [Chlorociboria aeruginascens]
MDEAYEDHVTQISNIGMNGQTTGHYNGHKPPPASQHGYWLSVPVFVPYPWSDGTNAGAQQAPHTGYSSFMPDAGCHAGSRESHTVLSDNCTRVPPPLEAEPSVRFPPSIPAFSSTASAQSNYLFTQYSTGDSSHDFQQDVSQPSSFVPTTVPNDLLPQPADLQQQYSAPAANNVVFSPNNNAFLLSNARQHASAPADNAAPPFPNAQPDGILPLTNIVVSAQDDSLVSGYGPRSDHSSIWPSESTLSDTSLQEFDLESFFRTTGTRHDITSSMLQTWPLSKTSSTGVGITSTPISAWNSDATTGPFDTSLWANPFLCGTSNPPGDSDPDQVGRSTIDGSDQGHLPTKGPPQAASPDPPPKGKRRRANEEERDRIKRIRRRGACLRCRLYRMKVSLSLPLSHSASKTKLIMAQCDEGAPCQNCLKVRDTATIFKQPCIVMSIKDVMPFRPGSSRTGKLRSELPVFSWTADTQVRQIIVSPLIPGISQGNLPSLQIKCRIHHVGPEHILEEAFESMDKQEFMRIKFPPYACYEAESTRMQKAMEKYLDDLQPFGEEGLDRELTDEILLSGLKEARRYSKKRNTIVTRALKIQAAAWISEIVPIISGNETLGMSRINNDKFSQHGQLLIPVSLDSQLDHLYIEYMFRNLKVVLTGLSRLIFTGQKDDKRKYCKQIEFARKFTGSGENFLANVNYIKRSMIGEWEYSARNIIYHFRAVVKGMVPFSQKWTDEMMQLADVDDEAMEYIRKTSDMICEREAEFACLGTAEINNDTTTPLVWIAQMLTDN